MEGELRTGGTSLSGFSPLVCFQLLVPHFRFTLEVDMLARQLLLSDGGSLKEVRTRPLMMSSRGGVTPQIDGWMDDGWMSDGWMTDGWVDG